MNAGASRLLPPVIKQTQRFHADLFDLWSDIPEPASARALVVSGFCEIVRQHAISQMLLAEAELDVSATTLVRPTFEALVRAIWSAGGASDDWIQKFLIPSREAVESDSETAMGPAVQKMLDEIRQRHPAHIHASLVELKERTWRTMHSYVHGGIRPLVQGLMGFHEHEVTGVVINANGMLLTATNLLRMSRGIQSPQLPELQRRHAGCLPNAKP